MIRGETPGGEEFIYMLQRQYRNNINTFDFQEGTFTDVSGKISLDSLIKLASGFKIVFSLFILRI